MLKKWMDRKVIMEAKKQSRKLKGLFFQKDLAKIVTWVVVKCIGAIKQDETKP